MPDVSTGPDDAWTIARVLSWAAEDFSKRGLDTARLDAEVLLGSVLGVDRIQLIVDSKRPLSPDELSRYRDAIRRRRLREPVAYILGEREFYGLGFRVDSRVLIPRPDTETLVDVALERTAARDLQGAALDLCTGSGCVAIAFATMRRTWSVTGVDASSNAIDLARVNGLRLGTIWGVQWLAGDLYAPLADDDRFDLVVANPPYIPTAVYETIDAGIAEHEPREALHGGRDGLDVTRRVVDGARHRLRSGGVLAVEVMEGQAARVSHLLARAGFESIERRSDYGGIERVVSGRAG